MKYVWRIVATFFGLGLFPIAPGTLTSLVVVLIYRSWIYGLGWPYLLLVFLALLALGTPAASFYSSELKRSDPGSVVVDEAAGQFLVLALVPSEWTFLIAGFLLFRFFDIVKPFPIRRAERLPAGWGIMADDILAALMAKAVLHLFIWLK
ncbi:MAG: phosphatidylglycerophosphatase A [Candidatus Aminicenantales bacterium]